MAENTPGRWSRVDKCVDPAGRETVGDGMIRDKRLIEHPQRAILRLRSSSPTVTTSRASGRHRSDPAGGAARKQPIADVPVLNPQ
jgi:hypothetical protein